MTECRMLLQRRESREEKRRRVRRGGFLTSNGLKGGRLDHLDIRLVAHKIDDGLAQEVFRLELRTGHQCPELRDGGARLLGVEEGVLGGHGGLALCQGAGLIEQDLKKKGGRGR